MKLVKFMIVIVLIAWFGFLFIRPLSITTGDLGRHLKNGEIILTSFFNHTFDRAILDTNFYSYTNPDFPFVNHHWGSGVILYSIWKVGGFMALQIGGLILSLATLSIFFYIGYKRAGFWPTALTTLFLMPLIADRRDVRPELFSYLLLGIFFWFLLSFRDNPNFKKRLFILPFLLLIWVNLHIYFIFGFALLGIFLFEAALKKQKSQIKIFGSILALSFLCGLVNPFGWKIYTYPFSITQNLGISVEEIVPTYRATATILDPARAITFKLAFFIFWILYLAVIIKDGKKFSWYFFLSALLLSLLGWHMVRNLTMFSLFFVPLLAISTKEFITVYGIDNQHPGITRGTLLASSIIIVTLITAIIHRDRFPQAAKNFGIMTDEADAEAGKFLQENSIFGNLFNDFDSGGYAAWYGYPRLRPYIDQRPEAYPTEFLQKKYVPLRLDPKVWNEVSRQYDFNVILLSIQNQAPSVVQFMVDRLNDPIWAPVLSNRKHIVFLRRNQKNTDLIRQHEIPKEKFIR